MIIEGITMMICAAMIYNKAAQIQNSNTHVVLFIDSV
jgi:hypothetical protein